MVPQQDFLATVCASSHFNLRPSDMQHAAPQTSIKGVRAMGKMIVDRNEVDFLNYEISDEDLETAVRRDTEKAGGYTLSFCTALTDCPGP